MEIPIPAGSACARCGDDLDDPLQPFCRMCRLAPPPFERAVSYAIYQDRMRDAIHALKYDGLQPAAGRMGAMLAQAIAQLAEPAYRAPRAPADLLVLPIPLHPSRHAVRGFNQARLLATYALRILAKSHPGWKLTLGDQTLLRHRATESQANLTPHQRRANVKGAFKVSDRAAIDGRHILLVDDIFTTGATMRSAAATLRSAGAASVWVATLARARRVNAVSFHSEVASMPDAAAPGSLGEPDKIHTTGAANVAATSMHAFIENAPIHRSFFHHPSSLHLSSSLRGQ